MTSSINISNITQNLSNGLTIAKDFAVQWLGYTVSIIKAPTPVVSAVTLFVTCALNLYLINKACKRLSEREKPYDEKLANLCFATGIAFYSSGVYAMSKWTKSPLSNSITGLIALTPLVGAMFIPSFKK